MRHGHAPLIALTLGLLVATGLGVMLGAGGNEKAAPAKIRIGTYDNRIIAMAYAASEYSPVKEKRAEMEKAKSEGDEAKVKELEHWGVTLQKKLHFQGFGRYPVDDLLASVADKIPGVAAKHHLDAIVWICDFHDPNVEIVDVTDDLAMLFNPPENVKRNMDQMRAHKPVPFETLIDLPADK
jgi:hypothetical protein